MIPFNLYIIMSIYGISKFTCSFIAAVLSCTIPRRIIRAAKLIYLISESGMEPGNGVLGGVPLLESSMEPESGVLGGVPLL